MAAPMLTNPHQNISWLKVRDPSWPDALPVTQDQFDQLPDAIKKETMQLLSNHNLDIWFARNNFYNQNQLIELSNLDYARDYHHFDKVTSEFFVEQILKNFNN